MFILRAVVALSVVVSATAPFGAMAQEAENVVLQMEEFTCRDMLIRSGFERDFTVAYMHGFMSGKLNETEFDVSKLTAATDSVLDYCISNPDAAIMAAFEQARG